MRGRPEDAEDLVQETLVALHTKPRQLRSSYPLTAWLYAIARYRLIDFLRRAKHRTTPRSTASIVGEPDPEYAASDAKARCRHPAGQSAGKTAHRHSHGEA